MHIPACTNTERNLLPGSGVNGYRSQSFISRLVWYQNEPLSVVASDRDAPARIGIEISLFTVDENLPDSIHMEPTSLRTIAKIIGDLKWLRLVPHSTSPDSE